MNIEQIAREYQRHVLSKMNEKDVDSLWDFADRLSGKRLTYNEVRPIVHLLRKDKWKRVSDGWTAIWLPPIPLNSSNFKKKAYLATL